MHNNITAFCLISATLVLTSLPLSAAQNNQTALQQYCNSPELAYEYKVEVAPAYRVQTNHGAFMQLEQGTRYSASVEFLQQPMLQAGLSRECVEYLLTKADTIDQAVARVYFSFDSAELTDASRYVLAQLIGQLQQHSHLSVEGHTDNIGSDAYNFALGLRRAERVADYVQQQALVHVTTEVLSSGARQPLNDNATAQQRAQNRRVEIK
ncbi:OmpA family protein [Vibrio metschnikovii]|uniref:OmpA family protein n=1 Tax=bacterium 19CA03SA04 TaxID=2920698 RepID=A0AAU6SZW8_UNCXX|nr:OmpA family protein [Vibrio metschnikovii]EKO3629605.1 OmpA family protein [Vibrio metschnikovii]EKO3644476.1 OmpA family protein [Vibrio metschnikovii]EKO3777535.1 OmpA family protein [Vibrio metschnikovii]EKO3927648.1 OmpA family protein [Vibrio metschnikovii]